MAAETCETVEVLVRFYGELNDFLPVRQRGIPLVTRVQRRTSVKDAIERWGVPHVEVALVLVDGEPAGLDCLVERPVRITAYPAFRRIPLDGLLDAQPGNGGEFWFVVDAHLGKLAFNLRLLGFDTLYRNDAEDAWLAMTSAQDERVLLTRDRQLLMRSIVRRGYCVRSDQPREQLEEVLQRFELAGASRPFTRCTRCNGLLHDVAKEEVLDRLEPLTREHYDQFRQCGVCRQVYWRGSHYAPLSGIVREALAGAQKEGAALPGGND